MASSITRRAALTALGGVVAWPLAARAQQPALPTVGFLITGTLQAIAHLMGAFRQGLSESGYFEGRNVNFEFKSAEGNRQRFTALAAELVRRRVAVIVAIGGTSAAKAAKAATTTIPVVFQTSDDPVKNGLVASLNRPGENLTGFARFGVAVAAKRFELLAELAPNGVIAVLANPNNPDSKAEIGEVKAAADAIGRQVQVVQAAGAREIDKAFEKMVQDGAGALYVASDASYYTNQRDQLVVLAARHAVPASYDRPEYVTGGGLMSYASNRAESYRQMGSYVGRILKGTKPSDLPVLQPTTFELAINLKTARTIRLDVPAKLLALADEVVE
jgi:putative ABC transport system substrate-binding protein